MTSDPHFTHDLLWARPSGSSDAFRDNQVDIPEVQGQHAQASETVPEPGLRTTHPALLASRSSVPLTTAASAYFKPQACVSPSAVPSSFTTSSRRHSDTPFSSQVPSLASRTRNSRAPPTSLNVLPRFLWLLLPRRVFPGPVLELLPTPTRSLGLQLSSGLPTVLPGAVRRPDAQ